MIKRVYIEITTACNLRCSFCTLSEREPSFMTPERFRNVILQTREITPYVLLHVQGEPLMHPEISRIMDLCAEYGMHVQLVTNGTLIKEHAGLVSHPALRKISFSLQSAPFQTIPPREYLENILAFCEAASARDLPHCELRFWRSDARDDHDAGILEAMIKGRYEMTPSGRRDTYVIMPHVYVQYAPSFEWPSLRRPVVSSEGTCRGGRGQIAVLCDGRVVPCCLDASGDIVLGNLFETPLKEILAGSRYVRMVEGLRNGRLTEELCRRCTYRSRFDQRTRNR